MRRVSSSNDVRSLGTGDTLRHDADPRREPGAQAELGQRVALVVIEALDRNQDDVDDGPDGQPAKSDELEDSCSHLAQVEAIDTENPDENTEDEGNQPFA